jgi:hypothetical protein
MSSIFKKSNHGSGIELFRKTKSELGADRGPRAGSPRGVVVATSRTVSFPEVAMHVWPNSSVDSWAGRYRSQF